MPKFPVPTTPVDAYKAIIDQLVDETRGYGSAYHIEHLGVFSKGKAHHAYNDFIASLSEEHRVLLTKMLRDERDSAIGDVLAVLSWWVDCRHLGFTYRNAPMPVDLSGMGLHGDYVGRCTDWQWPDSDGAANKNA